MLRLWLFRQPLRMGLFEGYCYMKFTCKADRIEKKTAAPAVCFLRGGFTLLEVMVVIVIIGILASLAYSSLIDVVFTNRAKETAQAMRTFAERALMEAKRQNLVVELKLDGSNMVAEFKEDKNSDPKPSLTLRQPLSNGFSIPILSCPSSDVTVNVNEPATSTQLIGLSGITEACFGTCGGREYCGAVVKMGGNNSFEAWIKRGSKAQWSAI
jgi:prepilin-type N-terminal cleavage/methylation domain-containing protein